MPASPASPILISQFSGVWQSGHPYEKWCSMLINVCMLCEPFVLDGEKQHRLPREISHKLLLITEPSKPFKMTCLGSSGQWCAMNPSWAGTGHGAQRGASSGDDYICEQLFWRMMYRKSRTSSKISDEHLQNSLRVATTAIKPGTVSPK